MDEKELFDVPIYKFSVEEHTRRLERKRLDYIRRMSPKIEYANEENSHRDSFFGNTFDRVHWYPWKFNEIVGYIVICNTYSKITGNLWMREPNTKKAKQNIWGRYSRFYLYLNI